MIRFTGEVLGEAQLDRALTRFSKGFTDLSPIFEEIGDDFRDVTMRQQFEHEGYGWAPLSPGYAIQKRRRWGDKPILQASGLMRSAFLEKFTPGNVNLVSAMQADFGVNLGKPYPRFHQTGTSKMPAREVIRIQEADKRRATKIMHRGLLRLSREAGFQVVDS